MTESATNGTPIFLQLLVFTDCADPKALAMQLKRLELDCFLFKDFRDPQGIGVLTLSHDPEHIASQLRDMLSSRLFRVLMSRYELTMTARTFGDPGSARERLHAVLGNPEWRWAIWYSLRGTPAMAGVEETLHDAVFGRMVDAAGVDAADFGRILLKTHGLDHHGNDFVLGLHGRHLHQLSAIVEATRRTPLHSELVASSGPFFVGRTLTEENPGSARW